MKERSQMELEMVGKKEELEITMVLCKRKKERKKERNGKGKREN